MGSEVPLVYHRGKFNVLTQVAQHSRMSKQMRSLFYVFDRFKNLPYEEWVKTTVQSEETFVARSLDGHRELFTGYERSVPYANKMRELRIASITAASKLELLTSYKAYVELCADQDALHHESYDFRCLRSFFKGCPNMREVTLVTMMHCDRRLGAEFTAFEKHTKMRLRNSQHWSDAGLEQVGALAHAVWHSGVKLDSLTLAGISQWIFDRSTEKGKILSRALRVLVRPLRRLRMIIQMFLSDIDSSEEDSIASDDEAAYQDFLNKVPPLQNGSARKVLAEAGQLRVLELEFPQVYMVGFTPAEAQLDRILQDMSFPHLYQLSLCQCRVPGKYLIDLFLRHKTLRRLALCDIELTDGASNWQEVFTSISCQLPNLRKIILRGGLTSEGGDAMVFGTSESLFSQAIVAFILKGGSSSPSWDWTAPEYTANGARPSYVTAITRDDDMPIDDPARDYAIDEYDRW